MLALAVLLGFWHVADPDHLVAVSTLVAPGFGWVLGRKPLRPGLEVAVPVLGVVSFVFGVLYAFGAIDAAL